MSPTSKGWKDGDPERTAEPSPMGDVVESLLDRREFSRGMGVGKLARSWSEVVGDRLAQETRPDKLEGGTLVVAASSGPWGSQARFLAEEIRKRANSLLGTDDVKRVQVVVSPGRPELSKPL
jgi:hypothetical protein